MKDRSSKLARLAI